MRIRRRAAGTQRPDALYADRGYDHDKYRRQVREAGIKPVIARRGEQHDSGLGVYRWVVEQGFALLHWFRRLASDRKSATTSTKHSPASPAPSSAADASTTSQTVRSSK
jgi:transposase